MKRSNLLFLALPLVACSGSDDDDGDDVTTQPIQCRTAEYVAFDAANHANQDIRIAAYTEMVDRMKAAQEDPTTANAVFTDLQENVYTRADLRSKIQGRNDDHFDPPRPVGMELDMRIMAGFEAGKTATTAIDVALARQQVDKTLIHFMYLSVYHEMVLGKRSKWDEAYGYYGAPSDNAEGGRQALAAVATKRDGDNGTNLAASIFNGIIDGSCEMAKALDASGEEELVVADVASLDAVVKQVDEDMLKVLAYSVGHEAFDMVEIQTAAQGNFDADQQDTMRIKLAELDPYFAPLERLMNEAGGDSAMRATMIRNMIDAAYADTTLGWMGTFDAQGVIDMMEAEYGIDVRG